ncbi:MAG TPA: hypothetical protein VF152_02200 [Acidimicrobiia bacterium]
MVRGNALALLLLAGLILAATPALAEKGGNGRGNGNGGGAETSSIAIASVSGARVATTYAASYGASLTFDTTVERLAGWEYPMIVLSCYQDVNGDGTVDTSLLGPEKVFGLLNHPDATFTLDGSSRWAERGGDAVCRADLAAYGWRGGQQSIRYLASTGDWAAAG